MRDIAVTLAVFGSLPFILRRPWIGILVWTWLGFMNPHRLAWGFSTTLPFAMIVAITTLVAMMASKEPKKIPKVRETQLLFAFLLWMFVTTLTALYPEQAWPQMDKVGKILFMILVAMILINSRERLVALVWVIALSIGFYGIKGGIFTLTTGGGYHVRGPSRTFIDGNNEIGLALVMTIPLLYFLSQQTRRLYVRYALVVAMVLTTMAALGTQSRGAMLGLATMAVFLWLKSRRKIFVGLMIAFAVMVLVPMMPPEWFARMSTIKTYEQDASAMGRINAWWMAFNLAMDRVVGGGFEAFQYPSFVRWAPIANDVHDAHSVYFEVLGEHGFPGLAIFLALAVSVWFTAGSVLHAARRDEELKWLAQLMPMVQVSLVAYLACGAFLGMAYFDYYYNLVLVVVVAKVLVTRRQAEAAGARATPAVKLSPSGGSGTIVPASSAPKS
ncbi:MAG: putative O-glycosylation ligase, exosortase A system-associated [Betaproteobacteria bacterium CG2_30_68_42]|nr:MAG: putative O-glycosylation ligase, exosortase A system-associated [Betaproteobacteria bacterium CG2_30_68_42]